MHIQPNPIPLNGSTLACSVDKARLCVEVIVLFLVGGKGLADNIGMLLDSTTSGPDVIKLFSCSTQLSLKFFLLINVQTIVGIFTFMSGKK